MTGLQARIALQRGTLDLDVDLEVAPGEVLALLGPNGAGKSTTLAALAGLVGVDRGSITVDGRTLDDPATRTFVPPAARGVGVVFQDYLLFPHLSAMDNVAFGLRSRGADRRTARRSALDQLDRVGLAEHAGTRPGRLSGGQQQRVALARALVGEPALLLLDEPLAALDASTRSQIRSDLRTHLAEHRGATVLVTHDPLDAMVLADRLAVVEAGRIVQTGPPAQVARAPRTDYAARLVGLNLHRGTARGTVVDLDGGGTLTAAEPGSGPVFTAFAPSAVALHRTPPDGSARNVWPGTVSGLEQHGATVRVAVHGQPSLLADVTPAAVAELGLAPGVPVWAAVKATEVALYPA